jgi:hypothetical protein
MSGVSVVQPQEFLAAVLKVPCRLTLDKWAAINATRKAAEKAAALADINPGDMAALGIFEKMSAAEIERLRSELAKSTVFRAVTEYRRFIKETGQSNHPILWFFRLEKKDYANRRGAYKRQVKREKKDLRPLFDADGYLRRAASLLTTGSYVNVAMGLVALTGRRPGEILVSAGFEKTGEHTVRFSGQLKTKGSENARDGYEIYTLAPADTVIKALTRLRGMVNLSGEATRPGETLQQAVNRKTANGQSKAVRRYFADFIPDYKRGNGEVITLKPYNLRAAYGLLAARYFLDDWIKQAGVADASPDMFISEMLGHSQEDTATVESYEDFSARFLDTEIPQALRGGPVSAKDLKELEHA